MYGLRIEYCPSTMNDGFGNLPGVSVLNVRISHGLLSFESWLYHWNWSFITRPISRYYTEFVNMGISLSMVRHSGVLFGDIFLDANQFFHIS